MLFWTAAQQLALQHHLLGLVDAMQLKDALRRIDPNPCNSRHGRLPRMSPNDLILAHRCRWGPSTPTRIKVRRLLRAKRAHDAERAGCAKTMSGPGGPRSRDA